MSLAEPIERVLEGLARFGASREGATPTEVPSLRGTLNRMAADEPRPPSPRDERSGIDIAREGALRTLLDSSSPCALQTVYVAVEGEGTGAWRPVDAIREGGDVYRLTDVKPDEERWAFPPGSRVRCRRKTLDEVAELVAVALAD